MDHELVDIKAQHATEFAMDAEVLVAMTLKDGTWTVHRWGKDSVDPQSKYPTKAKAASRILQLLDLGPTTPQDYPETMEIKLDPSK
jgi:hypothetical protein